MAKNKTKPVAKYKKLFTIVATSLIIGFIAGTAVNPENIKIIGLLNDDKDTHSPPQTDPLLVGSSEIDLCFTPPSGCASVIANHISKAREYIYVQAYGITSTEIVIPIL